MALVEQRVPRVVAFVGRIVAGTVCGIVDALKGVDRPESVDPSLRRRSVS